MDGRDSMEWIDPTTVMMPETTFSLPSGEIARYTTVSPAAFGPISVPCLPDGYLTAGFG
jgi:hypothetical protein